jgi:hypothetical protein
MSTYGANAMGNLSAIIGLSVGAVAFFMLMTQLQADEVQDADRLLEACYVDDAALFSSGTCQPLAAILGVSFAACASEEESFLAAVRRSRPLEPEFPGEVLGMVRADMVTRIQKMASDSQTNVRKCP